MKLAVVFLAVIFMLVTACKNNKQQPDATLSDSIVQSLKIRAEDSAAITESNQHTWITSTLQQHDMDWQHLQLQEYYNNDSLEPEPIAPEPEFFKNYESVLRYSPDSNYALDIGSYGSVLVKGKDGKMKVEAGEPDSEIVLLDLKQNEKWSLFFVGPSSNIFDAKWMNKNNIIILGSFDEENTGRPDTLFWMVNIKDQFYRLYKWKR